MEVLVEDLVPGDMIRVWRPDQEGERALGGEMRWMTVVRVEYEAEHCSMVHLMDKGKPYSDIMENTDSYFVNNADRFYPREFRADAEAQLRSIVDKIDEID